MKGDKKMGKMHIFSTIGKKYAYFFPNCLRIYKIAKKEKCGAHPLLTIYFTWGKNINPKGGEGQNMNFKFNIHPACS